MTTMAAAYAAQAADMLLEVFPFWALSSAAAEARADDGQKLDFLGLFLPYAAKAGQSGGERCEDHCGGDEEVWHLHRSSISSFECEKQ